MKINLASLLLTLILLSSPAGAAGICGTDTDTLIAFMRREATNFDRFACRPRRCRSTKSTC